MTSPANPVDVDYGYQFQDGDDWDLRPMPFLAIIGLPWQRMAAVRIVDWTGVGFFPGHPSGQVLYDRNPGLPIHYCRDRCTNRGSSRLGLYIGYDWRNTVR